MHHQRPLSISDLCYLWLIDFNVQHLSGLDAIWQLPAVRMSQCLEEKCIVDRLMMGGHLLRLCSDYYGITLINGLFFKSKYQTSSSSVFSV